MKFLFRTQKFLAAFIATAAALEAFYVLF